MYFKYGIINKNLKLIKKIMFTKSSKEENKNTPRKCPKCLGEVPKSAKKCMHCGSNLPMELNAINLIATFLVIAFVIWAVVSCSKSLDEASKTPADPAIAASVCAQNKVEAMLKSPKSADFPWLIEAVLQKDGSYGVQSYVDAQNSFGAIIRTNFVCKVKVIMDRGCETECIFD
jgi:hypothetical protein